MSLFLRIAGVLWASPYTLVGLLVGIMGLCTGGQAQIRGRTVEFYGGAAEWLLRCLPGGQLVMAMTLGHSILGRTAASLDTCRDHELVHVRQYELWGPLFGPAYLLCALIAWIRGKNVWRDNPFERQAYKETGAD
jgi:hypothetical protein